MDQSSLSPCHSPLGSFRSPRITQRGFFDVLANPLLRALYKWHSVSVYAFENLFFLDRIDLKWRPLFDEGTPCPEDAHAVATDIVRTFIGEEAPWEITLSSKLRKQISSVVLANDAGTQLPSNLFDRAYELVVRDLTRSLQQFQNTELYRSYVEYEQCAKSLTPEEEASSDVRARTMARVRHLYKTTQPVAVVAHSGGPFPFCIKAGAETRGYAENDAFFWRFFDLTGRELLRVPANVFENSPVRKGRLTRSATVGGAIQNSVGSKSVTNHRGSSASGRRRLGSLFGKQRSNSTSENLAKMQPKALPEEVMIKRDVESGAFLVPLKTVKMWWRFHLLKPAHLISGDGGSTFEPIAEHAAVFDEASRIQMVDPTRVRVTSH